MLHNEKMNTFHFCTFSSPCYIKIKLNQSYNKTGFLPWENPMGIQVEGIGWGREVPLGTRRKRELRALWVEGISYLLQELKNSPQLLLL